MALTKVNSILVDGAINTTAAGNVGIGTATPTGKLDVSSSSAGVTAGDLVVDTANKVVYVGRQSSTSDDNSILVVRGRVNGTGTNQAIAISGSTGAYGTGLFRPNNDNIGFSTQATERMRINAGGDVGIGITSPDTRLVVYANTTTATQRVFNVNAVNTYQMSFHNSVGECGTITTGSNSVGYNSNSDYRLKENIVPMTGALSKLSALKPVTYKWKSDGSDGQGFIAHELQAVVPEAVTGEKDAVKTVDDIDEEGNIIGTKEVPQYQGIDTSFLVATLTAAIQEQQAIITDLTTRLEALEAAK
jgi:hypothetical protein